MPEVVIFLAAGRTVEQKRGLMRDITDAVVRNLDTPAENVVVSIMETALENKARGGVTCAERRAKAGGTGGPAKSAKPVSPGKRSVRMRTEK